MWYPTGGCSVHKPPFVRGPHGAQRALCPQGRPTAGKKQRETPGKRLVHYSSLKSSPASGFLKEDSGRGGGCGLRLKLIGRGKERGKRVAVGLARCGPSPNAPGEPQTGAGSGDCVPAQAAQKKPRKRPFAFLYSMKALGEPLPQRLPSCEPNLGRREHFPCWEIIPAERGGQQQAHPGERCASASSAPGSTAPAPGAAQPPAPLGVLFSHHRFRWGCAATLGSSRVLDRKQTPNSTAFFFQLHVCCLDAISAGSLVPGREGLAGCAGTRGRSPGSSFARAELAL